MDREQGFYWVSEAGDEPEIALWQDGEWWVPGDEEAAPPATIQVLSERLRHTPRLRVAA